MEKIFKLNQNSSLVMQVLNKPVDQIVIEIPTNHILVIDCSGSMWKDLEKIRHQLKNKLSSLVKQNDTISIVWFSGRNEFGVLKEQVPIKTLKDLSELHQAIDRYLTDIGLTGFKQPLELVSEMIDRIASKRPNTSFNMMFLTDGYDNQSNKSDILEVCKTLSAKVHSSTLIEYGNYANTQLLNEMASILGGQVIYSENFIQYEPVFDSVLSKSLGSAKKKEIKLSNKPKFDIAVSISENSEITVFNVDENNTILVPENTINLTYMIESNDFDYYLNDFIQFAVKDVIANRLILQNIYSMIYVLSQRNKSKEVYDILESLGDKQLSYKYANSFGKQNLSDFNNMILSKIKLEDVFFKDGFDLNSIPPSNSYCLLNLFDDLINDTKAKWYPDHKEFKYNRIGAKRKQVNCMLNEAEKLELNELSEKLKTANLEQVKEITEKITSLTSNKFELKFEAYEKGIGYPISNLVWNEDKPNLSIQTMYKGFVALPSNKFNIDKVDTFIFRNYTFIKDGIVNVDKLPISLSQELFVKLQGENIIDSLLVYDEKEIYVLNLRTKLNSDIFPIINRDMIKKISAIDTFKKAYELLEYQAAQKVFSHFEKTLFPKESKGLKELYGDEATLWLNELGFTDFNGFSPKTITDKANEIYIAKELVIAIKGLSSLPSINAVQKKLDADKSLTPSELMINTYLHEYKSFLNSSVYIGASNQSNLLETWLKDKKKFYITKTRELIKDIAKIKFAIILGQTWFMEFPSIDDSSLSLKVNELCEPKTIEVRAELKEVEIKI